MKRILINTALLLTLIGTFSACKKQLDDNYVNPEQTSVGSLGKLLTGMFLNTRIHPSYWDYYTFKSSITAPFAGLVALGPGSTMYTPNTNFTQSRWVDFYEGTNGTDYNYNGPGIMSNYTEMVNAWSQMTPAQQAENEVYIKCARVLVDDQAAQMVDLWGDIPFFNTNTLNGPQRAIENSPFDDAAQIYDSLITDLKNINTFFDTVKVANNVASDLKSQDILLKGNTNLWRRYANSIRLRLLMRISNVNEAVAQPAITAMLQDTTNNPLVANNNLNVTLKMSPQNLKSDLTSNALANGFASSFVLDDLMLGNDDPRTTFYWEEYSNTSGVRKYISYKPDNSNGNYESGQFSGLDSATFIENLNVPGVLMTASEVSFLEAEAFERWGLGDAEGAYNQGIQQSVDFYYSIYATRYANGGYATHDQPQPTTTDVANYLAQPAIAYGATDHLNKIYTQKWLHFFVLQPGEAWSEYRRTGYPVQTFQPSPNGGLPPVRVLYPSSEALYNPDNYSKVAGKDLPTTKIFWDVN
jgi:hypothetical protein